MNRRDLFHIATGGVAAFLLRTYGAPPDAAPLVEWGEFRPLGICICPGNVCHGYLHEMGDACATRPKAAITGRDVKIVSVEVHPAPP